jgi:hypothetical protein
VGLNQRVNPSDKESKRFVNLLRRTNTNSMSNNRAARCQNVAGISKEKEYDVSPISILLQSPQV